MNARKCFMKRFLYFALFLTMLITACGSIPGLSPVATPTPLPTITTLPTNTPTQMPTATPLPSPTATEPLTPQEQLERDYGHLVSKDEKCVKGVGSASTDYIQNNTTYAYLHVHATNPNNAQWMTIELGRPEDKKPREVLVLPVVCRDANGGMIKFGLILGGKDFGKDGADLNAYYNYKIDGTLDGKGFQVVSAQEILENIEDGLLMAIDVPIKPGDGDMKKPRDNWEGATNELGIIAINTVRYDEAYSQVVNQIAEGGGEIPDNLIIIPSRLELNPQ